MKNTREIEIIEVHEIWPETKITIKLLLARSTLDHTFTLWAERLTDESTIISNKHFDDEKDARKAFKLLTEVLVEINDPLISFLKDISTIDPQ